MCDHLQTEINKIHIVQTVMTPCWPGNIDIPLVCEPDLMATFCTANVERVEQDFFTECAFVCATASGVDFP